jgi:hypothetical protein
VRTVHSLSFIDADFFAATRPQLVHDASLSTHGLSAADELELARRLDMCPKIVWLVAAVAGSVEVGHAAADEAPRQVPVAAGRIADWARKFLEWK